MTNVCTLKPSYFNFRAVWPDLAKFCHFGKSFPVSGKFLTVYFLVGKILSWLWQFCDIIGLIFIAANGQILKNNLTIWSQCFRDTLKNIDIGRARSTYRLTATISIIFKEAFPKGMARVTRFGKISPLWLKV